MSHDDEEEAFFREQMARMDGSGHHKGGHHEREEEEFFRAHSARLESDEPAPAPQADSKKRGVFGRAVPSPGLGKLLKGKGSGSKPPAAPSTRKPPAAPAASMQKKPIPASQSKKQMQDDDSDEDALSISSEDEVDTGRKAALERQETRVIRGDVARAPPAVRGPPPQYKPDDEGGDGDEEPELWEEVREEELVRKVREMRDPRGAAPPAPIPPTPTLKRLSSRIESGFAGQTDFTDPLGLGPINLKTLSLAKSTAPPVPQHEVEAQADKLLYYEESFNSRFYLARIHKETPVQELENGKLALKRDIASHKEQLKKLVKDNFDIFISCKNTIDDIHLRLDQMESDSEGAGTERLSVSIRDCDEVARRAFSPLLERQAQVDRIRSVQGLLQRFRTLFNLPSVIRGFVKKGEYDSAVHEFVKAKSLQLPVNSGILKKVLEEVDKVVQEFKEVLYSQMADPDAELSQVEYKIKLLAELEPEGDPVWHYLQLQDRRIRGLLEGAQHEADLQLEALQQRVREKQQAEARWKQLQFESSQGSEVDLSILLGDEHLLEETPDLASAEEADALQAGLIRRLTAVLRQQVPRFWKLTLSIFAGRFANFSQQYEQGRMAERTPQQMAESGSGRYTKHSQDEVAVMVLGILGSYENKVMNAFAQLEVAGELRPYMREAVGEIASAFAAIKPRDCAPVQAVAALQRLRVEVTKRFVQRLCYITRGAAMELVEEEDWVPPPTVQRAGSPYAISSFPIKFRDTVASALDHVTEVLAQLAEEEASESRAHGMESITGALRSMYDSVKTTFFEAFLDFCECVEKSSRSLPQAGQLAEESGEGPQSPAAEGGAGGQGGAEGSNGEYSGLQVGVEVKSPDQRILMLLSNAGFCRTMVVPQLADKYHHLWMDPGAPEERRVALPAFGQRQPPSNEADRLLTDLERNFLDLETTLGDKYIEIKAGHLGMAVIKYFLEDGTSWATAPPVKGLRDSALELMHPLVAVHAEVHAGCRPFVEKAINMLAEGLMDALNQVALQHQDLQHLDANAYCQLSLELDYFETVLHPFASQSLEDIVDQLREMLRQRAMESIEAYPGELENERALRRNRMGSSDELGGADAPLPQSAEELKQMAEGLSADLLPGELRRTKVNVYCFTGRQLESEGSGIPPAHDTLSIPHSPYRQPGAIDAHGSLHRTYSNSSSGSSSMHARSAPVAGGGKVASALHGGGGSLRGAAAAGAAGAGPAGGRRGKSLTAEPQGLPPMAAGGGYGAPGADELQHHPRSRAPEAIRPDAFYGSGQGGIPSAGGGMARERNSAPGGRATRAGRHRIEDEV